jgi:hypothetical protein
LLRTNKFLLKGCTIQTKTKVLKQMQQACFAGLLNKHLKGLKYEIFVFEFFKQSKPVNVGDLEITQNNLKYF